MFLRMRFINKPHLVQALQTPGATMSIHLVQALNTPGPIWSKHFILLAQACPKGSFREIK